MKVKKGSVVYVQCECGDEGILIKRYGYDYEVKGIPDSYDIAFFKVGCCSYHGFWDRVKFAWHVIRYGHPYADMIVLNKAGAERLRDGIDELLNDKDEDSDSPKIFYGGSVFKGPLTVEGNIIKCPKCGNEELFFSLNADGNFNFSCHKCNYYFNSLKEV